MSKNSQHESITMTELPKFMWQYSYKRYWFNYSIEECCLLNNALKKHQKTVILPSNDPRQKISIHLEKMCHKNLISGLERHVRCLLATDGFYCWSWKNEIGESICYVPHITLFLEIAFKKKTEKIDFFFKNAYEIDLKGLTETNKNSGCIHMISREEITPEIDSVEEQWVLYEWSLACEDFISKMIAQDEQKIKNILFDLPVVKVEIEDSLIFSKTDERISALQAEARSCNSSFVQSISVHNLCPNAQDWHVYYEDTVIYHAPLSFMSFRTNSNRLYLLQLLEYNNEKKYALWHYWGRVGCKGQGSLLEFGANLDKAKSAFHKKFFEKTSNHFGDKNNFQQIPEKYDLVDMKFFHQESTNVKIQKTKIDKRIQNLIQMVCNKKTLEEAAKEMSYNSKAIPLSSISTKQIEEGYTAIRNIVEILQAKGVSEELLEACNIFYTKIPHDFGRRRPPLLFTVEAIEEKLIMLEALSSICLAMKLIGPNDGLVNPIDAYYRSINCLIIPVEHDSEEFKILVKCLKETHGPSHAYRLELVDAFKCKRAGEEESFLNHGNVKLLWHGSRLSNWISILNKGLQIAPPEAPSRGLMFGKGIYFADISTKSAKYCYATKGKMEGLLLLCEVSLGTELMAHHLKDISDLPHIFHSVFGVGKWTPSKFESTVLSYDALAPFGPLEETNIEDLPLNYNQYVVYNARQIKMKYLLKVKFVRKSLDNLLNFKKLLMLL